jgi:hypothetical protein
MYIHALAALLAHVNSNDNLDLCFNTFDSGISFSAQSLPTLLTMDTYIIQLLLFALRIL